MDNWWQEGHGLCPMTQGRWGVAMDTEHGKAVCIAAAKDLPKLMVPEQQACMPQPLVL